MSSVAEMVVGADKSSSYCLSGTTTAALAALVTGVALVVLAALLASGRFTPLIQAHAAYYGATILAVLSIIPFAISACLLCRR